MLPFPSSTKWQQGVGAEGNPCTSEEKKWVLEAQHVISQRYLISNMHVCRECFQWTGLTFIFRI